MFISAAAAIVRVLVDERDDSARVPGATSARVAHSGRLIIRKAAIAVALRSASSVGSPLGSVIATDACRDDEKFVRRLRHRFVRPAMARSVDRVGSWASRPDIRRSAGARPESGRNGLCNFSRTSVCAYVHAARSRDDDCAAQLLRLQRRAGTRTRSFNCARGSLRNDVA